MPSNLTSDQIEKLRQLGIDMPKPAQPDTTTPALNKTKKATTPPLIQNVSVSKTRPSAIDHRPPNIIPLLSISGLTILSFGGLVLLKGQDKQQLSQTENKPSAIDHRQSVSPTQVPKSIQHYLLASQQYFTQALQIQNVGADPSVRPSNNQEQVISLLNQSILAATEAIKEFPNDHRGFYQRAKIYQSLIDSKPELGSQTIADLAQASKLNPTSAEITHDLASLFAKKGDAQNTLVYLNKTVALEPTKAQNFYDLAKIQQQAGLIPQAVDTYNRLLPLLTDINQKTQVEAEKKSLEQLLSQHPIANQNPIVEPDDPAKTLNLPDNPPTLEALADSNFIIAAPETAKKIEVQNQTDSNSLAGSSKLSANQKDITITNNQLTATSQVYLSVTKGGKNQTLKVVSKGNKSFTVGFDTPIPEDVEFKWWIIN